MVTVEIIGHELVNEPTLAPLGGALDKGVIKGMAKGLGHTRITTLIDVDGVEVAIPFMTRPRLDDVEYLGYELILPETDDVWERMKALTASVGRLEIVAVIIKAAKQDAEAFAGIVLQELIRQELEHGDFT